MLETVPLSLPSAVVTRLGLYEQVPYARRARVTDCTLHNVPSWSLVVRVDSVLCRVDFGEGGLSPLS